MKSGFDLLWAATIAGGAAVAVILICFGYLTYENAGSKTFSLAAAALASAMLVFCIQAAFELQPSESKTFITVEYTVDRAKPEIRQWAYSRAVGWRIHIETDASKDYAASHVGEIPLDDDLSNIQRLITDMAIASTISYFAIEQFDWQLNKVQYRGRRGEAMTRTSPGSKPNQCFELTSDAVRQMLERSGNVFASSKLFLRPHMCLPPGSQVDIQRDQIVIKTPLLELRFDFDPSGAAFFQKPGDQQITALKDGKSQFVTSYVGLSVTTIYSGLRAQSRQMPIHKDWAARVVAGAQEWFEAAP